MILGLSPEGRRNVATKEQQDYISGKRYEAQKNINRARDKNGVFKSCAPGADNMHLDDDDERPHQNKTILKHAHEEGVSHFTIGQNQKFAQGVDAIREVSPELADKILGEGPERVFKSDAPPVDDLPMVGWNP